MSWTIISAAGDSWSAVSLRVEFPVNEIVDISLFACIRVLWASNMFGFHSVMLSLSLPRAQL